VVGILGILKAGAAYVPLDPGYPRERLAYILDDAQVRVLLTQERFGSSLREDANEVVCLDSDWQLISQESTANPMSGVVAKNLIAVIYTSGSTGKPKGSLLQVQGFLNAFDWFGKECLTTDKPRILLMTPFSFDASFKVIITPLLIGGVLVLASADAFDAGKLLKTIKKQAVTNTFITPSLLYSLLDFAKSTDYRDLSSLRAIFFGGEPTDVSRLRPWLNQKNCNCRMVHNYGPSECSDVTTVYRPNIEEINVLPDLPIGAPINNVRVHVVDKNLNLQPIGLAGELCISGLSLSRGYLNRPGLTAEKFIPNPFATQERLYRTGDRVKWLPLGHLQFLGRMDYQVKIRGMRIEPGEIEAVLNQHPAVLDSIVVAREIIRGDKSLVGYVVRVKDSAIEVSDLRRYLKERLPEHMVPAALILIDKLPLAPNGKVDRDALPVPDDLRPLEVPDFVGPRNSVEEVLAGIWSGVLNLQRVGVHDNFFELGGHSLLATQVVSRIQNALQVELPVRRIFESPTVAELSEWMLHESGRRSDVSDMHARASILLKVAQLTDEEAEGWLQERSTLKSRGE
jgi:amino acid adenylation domain-containing protein